MKNNFAQKYDMNMVKGVVRPMVYKELEKVVDTMLLDQLKIWPTRCSLKG